MSTFAPPAQLGLFTELAPSRRPSKMNIFVSRERAIPYRSVVALLANTVNNFFFRKTGVRTKSCATERSSSITQCPSITSLKFEDTASEKASDAVARHIRPILKNP